MTKEVWREVNVHGYEDRYSVSNLGRVKVHDRIIHNNGSGGWYVQNGRIMKLADNGRYHFVFLQRPSRKKVRIYVHRLVAITFLDNPQNKPEVNHIDGNCYNNSLSNLEWVTPVENSIHALKNGLITRDPSNGRILSTNKQ